jgi:transposase
MCAVWAQPLPAAFPAVMPVLEALQLRETVAGMVTKQWNNGVDHADALMVLLLMILDYGGPRPLCDVADWAEQFGTELLLGLKPAQLHDNKIGQTLDALVPVDAEGECDLSLLAELLNRLADAAVCRYGIATDVLHYDFTQVSFTGVYGDSTLLRKGKGPGRRQFELGLNVTAEGGFPLLARVHPGATNHTVSVPRNLLELTRRLPGKKFCVVTDAAGLCYDNVVAYERADQHFLSPRQLQPWEKQEIEALAAGQFALARYRSGNDDRFWLHERPWTLEPKGKNQGPVSMRAVVVISEDNQRTEQEKADLQMRKLLERLEFIAAQAGSRGNYARADYVQQMADKALAKYSQAGAFVTVQVPEQPSLSWTVDREGFVDWRGRRGRWVLFTNLPAQSHSADDLLEIYRGRHVVEASFRQLKSELELSPVFVHLDNRLHALAGVYVIALMVLSLLQLLARRAELATKRGQALTARELLRHLKAVTAVVAAVDGQLRATVGPLSDQAQQYLTAMGFPDAQHWITVPPLDHHALSRI